ncbi:ribosomal protein S5 alanine N-acetyltransferase [Tateyamaria omphalii]|uniref:ribosomal protein S5-alanine N-acetyltransferase n=1 Tax=Tateyamaria omphalii TaxID=299262 RepID=UPI0016739198|nr:ribosomal protein S5-alanine N-acetyltransferase [Tateyamaria omphalii]GGX55549.1 ribosomal protein S5 alanine N-acetyltransferase [Tateyamaria omphalii]
MIVSDRTHVELVTADDAEPIFAYYQRNETHLRPWEPARVPDHHSLEAWQARAAAQESNNASGSSYHFAIRLTGCAEIIGLCNFNDVTRGAFLACYLGYSIDHNHEGRGLMYEALSVTIPAVFDRYGLHRVMANYMPANTRSGALLERLGFEKEGYARKYLKIADVWEDHVLTSLIRSSGNTYGG